MGNAHDPAKGIFGWNFRDFNETFSDKYSVKLGTAGLIYKNFGMEYIAEITGLEDEDLERIHRKIYGGLVYHFDANERGLV